MNYDNIISERCRDIRPSGIRRFFDIANTMEDVISLGVGEPDFQTPYAIRRAAVEVLEKRKTIYTANAGLIELRRAISKYVYKRTGVEYHPENEMVVTVGGSEAIDLTIRAIVSPGDEVLVVEPSFVCYSPIVALTGGVPIALPTVESDEFRLTPEILKAHITDRTKLLILPFPNNPTGAVMRKCDLEAIAEVLRDTNIMVLTDEIYAELTYGEKHFSIISLEGMKERTIYVNGFSKAFAMTGWRLGYCMGPEPIIKQMLKIHQYAIMCSPTVSQYAAITALESCDEEVKKMVDEYNVRRRFVVDAFNRMGLHCFEPMGAFYVFPCIKSTGLSSEDFCEKLLYEYKVAVVPGDAFGASGEGFIRVSYAYSLKHLMEAVKRIEEFLSKMK